VKTIEFDGELLTVHYDTDRYMFRHDLDETEKEEFRTWGREHWKEDIDPLWHPLVQNAMWLEKQKHSVSQEHM